MNKGLLRSVMALHGETYKDLAVLLGCSEATISLKINEKNAEFRQGEIAKIRQHYNLTAEQVANIFFG